LFTGGEKPLGGGGDFPGFLFLLWGRNLTTKGVVFFTHIWVPQLKNRGEHKQDIFAGATQLFNNAGATWEKAGIEYPFGMTQKRRLLGH